MENQSKFRVSAKALKQPTEAGGQVYRSNYRIFDERGEEIETSTGTRDFGDITSAFNEAFAMGHKRLLALSTDILHPGKKHSSPTGNC